MAELAIRPADANDFEVISDVYRRSSLSNAGDREVLLANPEVLVFEGGSIREGRTRAAVADGRVVGFATMTLGGEVAELDDLFVDPAWMRRGVARALVLDAVSVARAGGSKRIEVTANAACTQLLQRGWLCGRRCGCDAVRSRDANASGRCALTTTEASVDSVSPARV